MTATELDVFASTLDKTHTWINDLMAELGWEDRHKAYMGLRVTLQALRDRLTVNEVAQLSAQLPMLVRGFYYEGWRPSATPRNERRQEQFLAHITRHFRDDPTVDPEQVARAVFLLLARRVSEGEIEDIKHILPPELRALWP